jgi:hypothetical protein
MFQTTLVEDPSRALKKQVGKLEWTSKNLSNGIHPWKSTTSSSTGPQKGTLER